MELTFEQFAKELEKVEKNAIDKVEEGLNEIAEDLLSVSAQLAPLDEGGLMENGSVDPAKKQGSEIVARVGYNKEYALKMHEDFYELGERSKRKPSVDGMKVGRKYLAQPLVNYSVKYAKHLTNKIGESFE